MVVSIVALQWPQLMSGMWSVVKGISFGVSLEIDPPQAQRVGDHGHG